jgi:hypothetical protein
VGCLLVFHNRESLAYASKSSKPHLKTSIMANFSRQGVTGRIPIAWTRPSALVAERGHVLAAGARPRRDCCARPTGLGRGDSASAPAPAALVPAAHGLGLGFPSWARPPCANTARRRVARSPVSLDACPLGAGHVRCPGCPAGAWMPGARQRRRDSRPLGGGPAARRAPAAPSTARCTGSGARRPRPGAGTSAVARPRPRQRARACPRCVEAPGPGGSGEQAPSGARTGVVPAARRPPAPAARMRPPAARLPSGDARRRLPAARRRDGSGIGVGSTAVAPARVRLPGHGAQARGPGDTPARHGWHGVSGPDHGAGDPAMAAPRGRRSPAAQARRARRPQPRRAHCCPLRFAW